MAFFDKITSKLKTNYKDLSVKSLSLAVKPSLIGDSPVLDGDTPTFYVLEEYSRSNSLLLEKQTQKAGLPSALMPICEQGIDESSAMIFLKHRNGTAKVSPRLANLIHVALANPKLSIKLVPVTILWGRLPDKEDSIFKLLMNDEWQVPSISKQLFNIGVMGRDSFVQFYEPKELQKLIADTKDTNSDISEEELVVAVGERLKGYLSNQRASILGPDLSDKRNISTAIMSSKAVQDAIATKNKETGKPINAIKKEVQDYIDEIASDYSYSVVRVLERFLMWLWTQLYDGVQVRHFERVRKLAPDHQIIYVPCHRSHMDYLLLSYVIHTHGLRVPNVAAGANLNIPILGEILRSGGAFFLRRSFRDNPLYGTVFKEYLHNLMQRNAPIEYFIEGGRSRTGRLLSPKLGMLAMTVASYLKSPKKPVVFIPTYISYERIMEGATYVGELKGKPKETENLLGLLKTARKIERIFGTVHLSFGKPLYLDDFIKKFDIQGSDDPKVGDMVQNLGVKIMQHINQAAVVNPVSLTALVLLSTPKAVLDESHFLSQLKLYQKLAIELSYDEETTVSDMPPSDMLAYALQLKLIEKTPHVLGNMIKVADKQAAMLSYFKNNILHIFIIPSLLAALIKKNGRINEQDLLDITRLLYPFLQSELFLKYAQKNIDGISTRALALLIETHVVVRLADGTLAAPDGNSGSYQKLAVLSSPAKQSLERYFLTLALLSTQKEGKLTLAQTAQLCHLVGQRLSAFYGNDLPDMFDKALFTNFLNTLIRTGYITVGDDEKLYFDDRIDSIAHYARLVLSSDALGLVHHTTNLSKDELDKISNPKKP